MSACGGIFDYTTKVEQLQIIAEQLQDPHVWAQPERAQTLSKAHAQLKGVVTVFDAFDTQLNELQALLELANAEQASDVLPSLTEDLACLEAKVAQWELQRMFPGDMDCNNAYLDIQAGSGGTEAQDWAEMLLRMYLRWGEQHGFQIELLEVSAGEVAGIKSGTAKFTGQYAYGWLRTETGIHRLVRLSPFDANKRRHTSFAAVFVAPEVDEHIEIAINPADLRIDTYRASGAGGQHVNRTDSAVRITHIPSGLVAQCQTDRSQHKNRERAMGQLRAKLYELEKQKRQTQKQAQEATKHDIGWGHQIRSYILDDARIKDLRTGVESGNVQAILDGNIDLFLRASLQAGL